MAMMFEDTGSTISLSAIEDYINCSICLNVIKKTITTSCCHRFCEKCITEWVDRNAKCPCCNKHLKSHDLYNDCQFDSLIENIIKEREKAETRNFEQVCCQSVFEVVSLSELSETETTPTAQTKSPTTATSQSKSPKTSNTPNKEVQPEIATAPNNEVQPWFPTETNPASQSQQPSTSANTASLSTLLTASNTASQSRQPSTSTNTEIRMPGPVEQVLRKHLQKSLADHNKYFESLRTEYRKKRRLLEEGLTSCQNDTSDTDRKPEKIRSIRLSLQELETVYNNCKDLVSKGYDRFLTENLPSLQTVPVFVSIFIVEKNLRLPNVKFSSDCSLSIIQELIQKIMIERQDKVTEWLNKPIYLFSPISKIETDNIEAVKKIISRIEDGGPQFSDVQQLAWSVKPVRDCQMKPGSEIVLYNCMKYQSDAPPTCYAKKHKAGETQTQDYYKCQDCGFNWICKACTQICHKGHVTSVHVLNNKPTWACCYCPKKKKCTF